MLGVELRTHHVGAVPACPGELCGGLYGVTSKCPCVHVTQLPRHKLRITVVISTLVDGVSISERLGLKMQPFISTGLTNQLIGSSEFKVIITSFMLCRIQLTLSLFHTPF